MVLHRSAPDQTIHPFRDRASLGRVLLWILAALIWPILAALTVPGSSADFVLPFLLVPVAVGFSAFSRYRMLRDTTWAFTQDSFTRILRGATLQSTEWGEVEILRPNRRRGRLRFSGDVDFELVARGRTSGEIRIAFPLSQTSDAPTASRVLNALVQHLAPRVVHPSVPVLLHLLEDGPAALQGLPAKRSRENATASLGRVEIVVLARELRRAHARAELPDGLLTAYAEALYVARDPESALAAARKALAKNPADVWALTCNGLALWDLGQAVQVLGNDEATEEIRSWGWPESPERAEATSWRGVSTPAQRRPPSPPSIVAALCAVGAVLVGAWSLGRITDTVNHGPTSYYLLAVSIVVLIPAVVRIARSIR
jgi:hypothetical protein